MPHLCTLLWKCVRCLKAAGLRGDPAPLTEDGAHISARSSAHMQTMNLNLLSSLRPVIPTSCTLLNRPLAGVQKRLDAERGGENEGKAKPHLQPGTSPELNLKHFTPQKMWRGNWATWKKDLSYNWSQFFRTSKLRKRSEERREQPAVGGNSSSQDIYIHIWGTCTLSEYFLFIVILLYYIRGVNTVIFCLEFCHSWRIKTTYCEISGPRER